MTCDVLIRGGRLVDGTGNPWRSADVAVTGDRIVAVAAPGLLSVEGAGEVVDASGKIVCPGFIDIQSHSLIPLFRSGASLSKITQGVTTEILGEMWTPAPFGGRRDLERIGVDLPPSIAEKVLTWRRFSDWLSIYAELGTSVNVGSFLGGAAVREWTCGWDQGDPTSEQLDMMLQLTDEAMQDGAFGIAPALIYPPSSYSPDSELTACARVVGRHGGVYIVHLRSEGDEFLEALDATIRLSQEADCPVEVYHLKASGQRNWHKMPRALERIDEARASGVDITADMYPYVASGTGLSVLIPDWAAEGGKMYENLTDTTTRQRLHDEMLNPHSTSGDFVGEFPDGDFSRADHVVPLGFQKDENRSYVGRTLTDIAEERGQDWADAAIDLLLSERQRIATVFFTMSEENLRLQMQVPWIKFSTDAGGISPEGQTNPTHPRGYGTYPRILGHYVRDEKVLPLEDAIRKMTGAVADRLRLKGRGQVREGFFADLIIFDPATIRDHATFTAPHQLSTGIEDVWVNGTRVLQSGTHLGTHPGRIVMPQ